MITIVNNMFVDRLILLNHLRTPTEALWGLPWGDRIMAGSSNQIKFWKVFLKIVYTECSATPQTRGPNSHWLARYGSSLATCQKSPNSTTCTKMAISQNWVSLSKWLIYPLKGEGIGTPVFDFEPKPPNQQFARVGWILTFLTKKKYTFQRFDFFDFF